MYNLIVLGSESWVQPLESIEKSRVLSYTAEHVQQRFMTNGVLDVQAVTEIPTIFASETRHDDSQPPARIGKLIRVQLSGGNYILEYVFDPHIPPIPNSVLFSELASDLDIYVTGRGFPEHSRNHWAIKDVDLFKVLFSKNIGQQSKPKVFNLGSERPDKNLVAVMMPFDARFNPVYEKLREVIEAQGMECKRADDFWQHDHIIQDIVTLISQASIVVCDLTARNANVFYETGIAHTLGRNTILITQSSHDIPFDLRHIRYIEYLGNTEGINKLGSDLASRLQTLRQRR